MSGKYSRHANERMMERFGVGFSAAEQESVVKLILTSKHNIFVADTKVKNVSVYRIRHRSNWVYIVFSKKTSKIITVLPKDNNYMRSFENLLLAREVKPKAEKVHRKKTSKAPLTFNSILSPLKKSSILNFNKRKNFKKDIFTFGSKLIKSK